MAISGCLGQSIKYLWAENGLNIFAVADTQKADPPKMQNKIGATMLIKDLKQISEKLYQAALDNQEAQGNKRDYQASLQWSITSFCWVESPQGIDFWDAVYDKDLDTARRIDKENGWGLFDDTEAVKETLGFKRGDKIVAVRDSLGFHLYKAGDILTFKEVWDLDDGYLITEEVSSIAFRMDSFKLSEESISEEMEALAKKAVEVTEKEKAEFDKMTPAQQDAHIDKWAQDLTDGMFNQSAINDGLPSDYVPPPPEPRKAFSCLYNDKQREETQGYWDRIHRVRHK